MLLGRSLSHMWRMHLGTAPLLRTEARSSQSQDCDSLVTAPTDHGGGMIFCDCSDGPRRHVHLPFSHRQ